MPAKTIPLSFVSTVQPPAQLGTVQLKPAAQGSVSYMQNIDTENDEFGFNVAIPGPAMELITNNALLTGVPQLWARFTSGAANSYDYIMLATNVLGATADIWAVTGVKSGGSPSVLASSGSITVTHSGHSLVSVQDMVSYVDSSGNVWLVVVTVDAVDVAVSKIAIAASITPWGSLTTIQVLSSGVISAENKMFIGADLNLYVTVISSTGAYLARFLQDLSFSTASAYQYPPGYFPTALAQYQQYGALAYTTILSPTFAQRKGSGRSGIILWDYATPTGQYADIPCPANYISAVVNTPEGGVLVFGGTDDGKVTIYTFNGYGFIELFTYIGELPRSRHSVTFDGTGRLIWITVDGFVCRLDFKVSQFGYSSGICFNQLGTLATDSNLAGGIVVKLLGVGGSDFLVSSGVQSGNIYSLRVIGFGNYMGDGNPGFDTITTPLVICGLTELPQRSVVKNVTINLNRALQSGEVLEVRLYQNGNPSYVLLGTFSYANDGGVASKQMRTFQTGNDNVAIGVAWKMTDGVATAPGLLNGSLDYNAINTV